MIAGEKRVTKLPIIKEKVTSSTSSSLSYTEDVCQAGTSGMNATRSEIPDKTFESPEHQLAVVNTSLNVLGVSPVIMRKAST